ncbi:MAG: DNA polymerase III subunit chi [Alphaproteobacteria bacterium]|nr:DNA polymerase III subunit chi [Alphaproteobacteria bacterium]MDD9919685.1 DNA polymerase III subunit chi [Alphaproteobacteria bacterium]
MVAVQFYQVDGTTPGEVDGVLPSLLSKIRGAGYNIVIACPSLERRDRLNNWLWVYEAPSFLPHGTSEESQNLQQPILLTTDIGTVGESSVLITLGGMLGEKPESNDFISYSKVLNVFDASNGQTASARKSWKYLNSQQVELSYFAQTAQGWRKQA